MRTADYALVTTLIAAASIVGFVSQAEAAMKARDKYAVLEKCEADARMRKNGLKAWSY